MHAALRHARMNETNRKPTQHATRVKYHGLSPEDKNVPHLTDIYQKIVGELRHITDSTSPDIMFYVKKLGAATHNSTRRHLLTMKNVLRYQKQTRNEGIIFTRKTNKATIQTTRLLKCNNDNSPLRTYTDSDFAGNDDRKSSSGAVHLFKNAPIAWSSGKQSLQALST